MRSPVCMATVFVSALVVDPANNWPVAVVGQAVVPILSWTRVPRTVLVSPAVTKTCTCVKSLADELLSLTPMIICQVSIPAKSVTGPGNTSLTQRPSATSQLLVETVSEAAAVVAVPFATSPSFLVTPLPVFASHAPRQVVGPVPVMAALVK